MHQNKILTTLNQALAVTTLLGINDTSGNPIEFSTLDGVPIGTADNSSTGEIGAKVIVIGDRATAANAPSVATPSQVNASAISVSLLGSNSARKGASIFNTGSTTLHLSYVTPAVATATAADLVTGAYFEVPFGYTGPIYGIWSGSPSGVANINSF